MSVVLNDLLTLVGRLDDAQGFDAPRERFRRFLLELTDVDVVRSLIEQSQRALGEQHHRALQDALVMLGRFLGFETTFGVYQRAPGAAKYDGLWRSRRSRLEIVLDVRTNQTAGADVEELSRSLAALASVRHHDIDVHPLGLCIATPMYGSRARLDDALRTAPSQPALRVASVRSLLWLADMVSAGRLTHDEIVRLLTSDISMDFAVDLFARFAADSHDDGRPHAPAPVLSVPVPARSEPAYWVATIGSDETATPEQFVESVIRGRQILGVGDAGSALGAHAGDWVCFSLGGKGIVGHACLESVANGAGLLRGSHRFRWVFRLKDIEIYDTPIALGDALVDRITESTPAEDAGPLLASLTREEFAELTVRAIDIQPEGLHRAG